MPLSEVHSARSVVLFSTFLKAERSVRFNSLAGSFHLGFDNELVARFPDGALRRQLLKSMPDRPGSISPLKTG
jgi:hypothetical protein